MTTELAELQAAVKDEYTAAYREAADAFAKDGNFDAMQTAYDKINAQVAEATKTRAETAADTERKERAGRDKTREDYGVTLLAAFNTGWNVQLSNALKKVAEVNPHLRFASIQIDIQRSTEGEGDAARAVTKIAEPRVVMSMSGASSGGSGDGTRKGLEVAVLIDGVPNTYKSVNQAAQALLGATTNTNKETLTAKLAETRKDVKLVSIGGNAA